MKDFKNFHKIDFAEYNTDYQAEATEEEIEKELYCKTWGINLALQNGMVIGSSLVVVAINVITCTIFEMIVKIEKKHSVNEETNGQFTKITLM